MILSETHQRKIQVTLELVDRALCSYRLLMDGSAQESVLYREINDLTASQRETAAAILDDIRDVIRELACTFQLDTRLMAASRSIIARNAALVTYLTELHAKYMRGGGDIESEVAGYLEPRVERIIDQLWRLSLLVNETSADDSSKETGPNA